jgi:hypothetical protein
MAMTLVLLANMIKTELMNVKMKRMMNITTVGDMAVKMLLYLR